MKGLKYSCLLLWICFMCACTKEHTTYHTYQTFRNEMWTRPDTVSLELHVTDSVNSKSEVLLVVRNTTAYKFQFIKAAIAYNIPDTTKWQEKTIALRIANERGDWLGDGFGKLYEQTVPITELPNYPPGIYTVKIAHTMQQDTIMGINDIGILIQQKKN